MSYDLSNRFPFNFNIDELLPIVLFHQQSYLVREH